MVSKLPEKLVNRLVNHLEKDRFLSDFHFKSSRSTADLLTVTSNRIARPLIGLGLLKHTSTALVALEMSDFEWVWHVSLLHKLSLLRYLVLLRLFSVIDSFESFWIWTSLQVYSVNDGIPQGSILGPVLFLPYIYGLSDDAICNIAIYADDTTLYFKCDQASDLWQQKKLASELKSEL